MKKRANSTKQKSPRTVRAASRQPDDRPALSVQLPDTLEFMQMLWALVHALERTSKRMAADIGVTGPQRLVLRVVGLAPRLSAGELAAVLHVHPSTLTGVLERLVRQKLVSRQPDARDRRRVILSLTARGERINGTRGGTVEAAVAAALEELSPSHRAVARRVLQHLAGHLFRTIDLPGSR